MMRPAWLALALLVSSAAADEVRLKNGDRLTGTIKSVVQEKLTIKTEYGGDVVVDLKHVDSFATDGPHKVTLVDGEELKGKLAWKDGRLTVTAEPAPREVEPARFRAVNEPPRQWHGTLGIALRATDGNTHTTSALGTAEFSRKTDRDEALVKGLYRYADRSGDLSERNAYGLAKYNYRLAERFYAFASAEFLSDVFKNLQLQTIVATGLGAELVKESWTDLAVEAGIGFVQNEYADDKGDDNHWAGRVSAKGRLDLPLGFQFKDVFTVYPNLQDSQDFTARNEGTLTNPLGGGWSVIGGVITEYDREPDAGRRRHDNTYHLGLGFSF